MRDSDREGATSVRDRFNQAAARVTSTLGSPYVLVAAVALVVLWAVSGPFFQFSETWQLLINTTTTIITFLMVFVIQASQNRDSKAIHLKLDEVIRAVGGARNELIGEERQTEAEIRRREDEFLRIAEEATVEALEAHHESTGHADADEEHSKAARTAARSAKVRAAARSAAGGNGSNHGSDRRSTTGSTADSGNGSAAHSSPTERSAR
jgi:low affinity Fe/Cu permease